MPPRGSRAPRASRAPRVSHARAPRGGGSAPAAAAVPAIAVDPILVAAAPVVVAPAAAPIAAAAVAAPSTPHSAATHKALTIVCKGLQTPRRGGADGPDGDPDDTPTRRPRDLRPLRHLCLRCSKRVYVCRDSLLCTRKTKFMRCGYCTKGRSRCLTVRIPSCVLGFPCVF
jgi:hypothetical protein